MFSRRSMLGGVAAGIAGIAMRPSPALAAAAAAVQDVDGAVRGALESYFSAQAKLTTWRNTEASGALTKSVIRSAAQFALQREDALRSDAAHVHQINGGYSSGRSVVEVHFVRERSASRMVIHLSDLGFYRHESIVDPLYPYAEFRTLYDVVLVTVAGVWTISEVIPIRHVRPLMIAPTVLESDPFIDRANLQSMLPGQTTSAAPAAESTDPEPDPDLPPSSDLPPASDESPAPNDKVLSAYDPQYSYQGVGGYNYGAMAAYANTYALSYNPNYPSWGLIAQTSYPSA
ncbi:hypothetical protein [Terrabacter sp. RAF57]|uniref:hypothetical protein n=1 Tax=Terrabacter sp. RAF57 TaxID=3233063 RepID=UPI003F9DE918